MDAMEDSKALLRAVYHHVVLPPVVPGKRDTDPVAVEHELLRIVISAAKELERLLGADSPELAPVSLVRASLETLSSIHDGRVESRNVAEWMRDEKQRAPLVLFIRHQNAGIIIWKPDSPKDSALFEAFEASAKNSAVMSARNALIWDFPDTAATIPHPSFVADSFIALVADFLDQASSQSFDQFATRTRKAGSDTIEIRESTDPALITETLLPILQSIGGHAPTTRTRKRVRDDISWHNSLHPWRRSPFWLIIRVACQRILNRAAADIPAARAIYKVLMALVHLVLLDQTHPVLHPDYSAVIMKKLGRRLAKLERDRVDDSADHAALPRLLAATEDRFLTGLGFHKNAITIRWDRFKLDDRRKIPHLPERASSSDKQLSLRMSIRSIQAILQESQDRPSPEAPTRVVLPPDDTADTSLLIGKDNVLWQLTSRELDAAQLRPTGQCKTKPIALVKDMFSRICDYLARAPSTYKDNPEQLSMCILTAMSWWVEMDRATIAACPLLKSYGPVFLPATLDFLQLPTRAQMTQARAIQEYLSNRRAAARSRYRDTTIFSDPSQQCFAYQLIKAGGADASRCMNLWHAIKAASEAAWQVKITEWQRLDEEYRCYDRQANSSPCTRFRVGRSTRCNHCVAIQDRDFIRITVHEHFLPDLPLHPEPGPHSAAILLELDMPEYLAEYREATWRILWTIACPEKPPRLSFSHPLSSLPQLQRWNSPRSGCQSLSLLSTTKSHLLTHYNGVAFPVAQLDVIKNFGCQFWLGCPETGISPAELIERQTFIHLCGLRIPPALNITAIDVGSGQEWPADLRPSSYEIVASRTDCPPKIALQEHAALQRLIGGLRTRWRSVLVELVSSNINFGREDAVVLIQQLAIQIGPMAADDDIGSVHLPFREASFCDRLAEQLDRRLVAISANWREINQMDMLITFVLRLYELCPNGRHKAVAMELAAQARSITVLWIATLREQIRLSADDGSTDKLASFSFSAALLCRRTLAVFADQPAISPASVIGHFTEASIALQENGPVSDEALPVLIQNMLVRDRKLVWVLKEKLAAAVLAAPGQLETSIAKSWPDATGSKRYIPWRRVGPLPPGCNEGNWLESMSQGDGTTSYPIHFNFLDGRLLIQGKPLGRLPPEIDGSQPVRTLFGTRLLRVYPSEVPGMTYSLNATKVTNGWTVLFGTRDQQVVVRARRGEDMLEYIPPTRFADGAKFDLPRSLLDNCVHWLHISTGRLEIRRATKIWKEQPGNWTVSIRSREARRGGSNLIDPYSGLFATIAAMFEHFVAPDHLTVYTTKDGISVEIRHLELNFTVTRQGRLYCRQLRAEIDPDQDVGTWYGLKSGIVLRDSVNDSRRSVILPLGGLRSQSHDMHVHVLAKDNGRYGRFGIDSVLGRITCPPDPELLYYQAHCHALTAFCLPDPLTGRTGTEEAFALLQSAVAKPWTPLRDVHYKTLEEIAALSPARVWYPQGRTVMQDISASSELSLLSQHDGFRPAVAEILALSASLAVFATAGTKTGGQPPPLEETAPLRERAEVRWLRFERPDADSMRGLVFCHEWDSQYSPRFITGPQRRDKVRWAMSLLDAERPTFTMSARPCDHLISLSHVRPHELPGPAEPPTVSSLLNRDDEQQWWTWVAAVSHSADKLLHHKLILSLLSVRGGVHKELIGILAAFARDADLRSLSASMPYFQPVVKLVHHERPGNARLSWMIKSFSIPCPDEDNDAISSARREESMTQWNRSCDSEGSRLASMVCRQWPRESPDFGAFYSSYIRNGKAEEMITSEWNLLWNVRVLSGYIDELHSLLDTNRHIVPVARPLSPPPDEDGEPPRIHPCRSRQLDQISTRGLFRSSRCRAPAAKPTTTRSSYQLRERTSAKTPTKPKETSTDRQAEIAELKMILRPFLNSPHQIRRGYATDLHESIQALENSKPQGPRPRLTPTSGQRFESNILASRQRLMKLIDSVETSLSGHDRRFRWLSLVDLWTSTTPVSLLEKLSSARGYEFGKGLRETLVAYGIEVTKLQRHLRLQDASLRDNQRVLAEEGHNPGHGNWNPHEDPDWLLLEIDSNILIRPDQVDVARATINPVSGSNSVLQMNMGKGKTSCIMPMAVASLADGEQLCRLIVPKALLVQAAHIFQAKLGWLLGRNVVHIPFSRRTRTIGTNALSIFQKLHRETQDRCGVMLCLPEHVLSFKLCGIQHLADRNMAEAREILKFESLLSRTSRDLLDESDFTLAVKTQLIYPSGVEALVDGHPDRWKAAESLLGLVKTHVNKMKGADGLQVSSRDGFPLIFFLKDEPEEELMRRVVEDVVKGRTMLVRSAMPGDPVDSDNLRKLIYNQDVHAATIRDACRGLHDPEGVARRLMLMRGLVCDRILPLCLRKRWNVQYGLHPDRDPIAVPFEAKGIPSEQAEFGHPDVAIILTCLAFYYTGLTIDQLLISLKRVLDAEDPAAEYNQWIGKSTGRLPEALRQYNLINTDDDGQMCSLWRALRYSSSVIDHYLNTEVFPRHAKQFFQKLQASGWDIPLFPEERGSEDADRKALTTGFSGTNDNRDMLPLTIRQRDLPALRGTNAEVLTYLLEARSRGYVTVADANGRPTEYGLLTMLKQEVIRILIDAGSSVLEMSNISLVKAWMRIEPDARAALFFRDNTPTILYRGGKEVGLMATPYAENLEGVLVYLDEAHTRGTDLKLPPGARAALTLGLGQTKDHTVQAAMRLRQLATTQSVLFVAPIQVDQSIRAMRRKGRADGIDSADVVAWLLEQTCRAKEQMHNLYHAQGLDFCHRTSASLDHPDKTEDGGVEAYCASVLLPEHQTLEEMYCSPPATSSPSQVPKTYATPSLNGFAIEVRALRAATAVSTSAPRSRNDSAALEEVEQEREVELQVEEVRQRQDPPRSEAHKFPGLADEIWRFAQRETPPLKWSDLHLYRTVFAVLAETELGQTFGVRNKARSPVYASKEWVRTVKTRSKRNDGLVRPVEWLLLNPETQSAMIVITEEAEELLRRIRAASHRLPTHLVAYAAPMTKDMLVAFERLDYYAYPPLPADFVPSRRLALDLGLFTGRLYFGWTDYAPLSRFFRGGWDANHDREGGGDEDVPLFTDRPVDFVVKWLGMCRMGQATAQTPMGYLCAGQELPETHPFFADEVKTAGAGKTEAGTVKLEDGEGDQEEEVEVDDGEDDDWDHWEDAEGNAEPSDDKDDVEEGEIVSDEDDDTDMDGDVEMRDV